MLPKLIKCYYGTISSILDIVNSECLIDDKAEEPELERIKNQRTNRDCSPTNVSISFMVLYYIGILIKYHWCYIIKG